MIWLLFMILKYLQDLKEEPNVESVRKVIGPVMKFEQLPSTYG